MSLSKYQVKVFPHVNRQLVRHAAFIANVSKPAALRLRNEFAEILKRLKDNPYQFPPYDDPNLPPDVYRKALFAKWYKVVFYIEDDSVYVDAIVDGRADWKRNNE